MKDIIYSPIISVLIYIIMFSLLWIYWSLVTVIIWAIFIVFYSEKRSNWKNFKKNQKL